MAGRWTKSNGVNLSPDAEPEIRKNEQIWFLGTTPRKRNLLKMTYSLISPLYLQVIHIFEIKSRKVKN